MHRYGGQILYLSARSLHEKRHYNLPRTVERDGVQMEAAGPKKVYRNHPSQTEISRSPIVVIVEGQADAISLGQHGISAIAICGADINALPPTRRSGTPIVALDNDETGQRRSLDIALQIHPLTRITAWPTSFAGRPIKDANDLLSAGATASETIQMLEESPTALQTLATTVECKSVGDVRNEYLKRFFQVYLSLEEADPIAATDLKPDCAKRMGMPISQFNRFCKAQRQAKEDEQQAENQEEPEQARIQYSAGGFVGGYLWEQCVVHHQDGSAESVYYVRLPNGDIEARASIEVGGIFYRPFPATLDLIRNESVLFPERPEEYGSLREFGVRNSSIHSQISGHRPFL